MSKRISLMLFGLSLLTGCASLEDRAPMIDGVEGRKSVEMIEAIYRSQREGRAIKFPLVAEGTV